MKKLIFAFILIIIITYVNFYSNSIYYKIQEYKFKKTYSETKENSYKVDYQFAYLKDNNNLKLGSNYDIVNTVFSTLNNGTTLLEKYCSLEYTTCIDDILSLGKNKNLLSLINGFVHPYNSFDNITFSSDGYITLKIEYVKLYDNEKIIAINKKVDEIIKNYITDDMSDKDKIKVIHDYIINHAKYDLLKKKNINDTTFQSANAYGVLYEGYGICSGYSDTMAIFLNKFNIPNYKISNDNHIWNLVKIDDKWLHLDLTWDDPISTMGNNYLNYDYFLISTEKLKSFNDDEHEFNVEFYKEAKEN